MTLGGASSGSIDVALAAHGPRIPGFEIVRELGRGGMGVVYQARDERAGRPVALKLLQGGHTDEQQRARFRIEAEAASRMQHPGIVQLYEVGEHDGQPFLVMELVSGGNLAQLLQQRQLPPAQAARLVRLLALAVDHAHGQRIIHRDLKPANILLDLPAGRHQQTTLAEPSGPVFEDDDFLPKISDFGLAKRLDGESTAWTRDGAVLGTAAYMAPEQAAGRTEAIGPATDIYALGAILYELLTSRPPFEAESWQQVVLQVLHELPRSPREAQPDAPPELEAICLQCLEKSPDRRYPTAQALADDLERFLEQGSVSVKLLSDEDQLRRAAELDGFRILETVGHGPRSTVYRALHEPLQRTVALKVYARSRLSRRDWEARLRQGADLWSAIPHPQIIPVHQAGWWNGSGYVATEYVPQGNLRTRIGGEAAKPALAIDLALQIAEVVSYLHRQGVVHGNLKSSNVLLAADGIPRLSDLRLTGGLFVAPPADQRLAQAQARLLPPEWIIDPQAEPRPYTDVYGLGCILYELLTGQTIPAADVEGTATGRTVAAGPPAPSQHNADVSPALDAIVLRCLRNNPWRRFRRVYDLQSALRKMQDSASKSVRFH